MGWGELNCDAWQLSLSQAHAELQDWNGSHIEDLEY